jgi:hypothetical protein
MSIEKPGRDPLDFLPAHLREQLRRVAEIEERDEIHEIRWLVKAYVSGRLRDYGDAPASVRIPLSPPVHYPNEIRVRKVDFQGDSQTIPPGPESGDE